MIGLKDPHKNLNYKLRMISDRELIQFGAAARNSVGTVKMKSVGLNFGWPEKNGAVAIHDGSVDLIWLTIAP